MEEELYKWFISQRSQHFPVSGDAIKEKSKALHSKIYDSSANFNASCGWLNGFKNRYGIRLLKICGEKLSSDQDAVPAFKAKFRKLQQELNLTEDQIYNADETGLYWKLLPDKTYVSALEKSAPGRKSEKARVTILVCTNASGRHKVKPLVIGQAKKPRAFKDFTLPVDYKSSKKAWMTREIFQDWFQKSFVPQVTTFLQQEGLPVKAVLILDNAPCHPNDQLLKTQCGSIFVLYFPPNVTPLLQPMDQNIIRITKLHYRTNLLKLAVAKDNIATFLSQLNLKHVICLLQQAWDKIDANMIKKCWRPLLNYEDLEEGNTSDDDDLPISVLISRQQSELEELRNLTEAVFPEANLSTDDLRNWTEIDDDATDNIEDTIVSADHVVVDSDEDDEGESNAQKTLITAAEAIKIFDKAIDWTN